jgi:hypothetical protein
MSSKNNVNKDFYTLAGRDRPNEVQAPTPHVPDEMPGHRGGVTPNFIPGAAPVGEAPRPAGKTGMRSGSRKPETARRDGKAPGQARPKAGTLGDTKRRSRRRAA